MINDLYLFFSVLTMISVILTFLQQRKKEETSSGTVVPYIGWFAFILCMCLSIVSVNVEYIQCGTVLNQSIYDVGTSTTNYTYSNGCNLYVNSDTSLTYLWLGIGILMFILAIIDTLQWSFENVIKSAR